MRLFRRTRVVALMTLLLAALAAVVGYAQNPQPPAGAAQAPAPAASPPARPLQAGGPGTIRTTVDLVQVDVTVNGRDGKPLKGLRQEQFSLAEDGHEQRIASFDYFDVEKIETAGAGGDAAPVVIPLGGSAQPEALREQVRDRRLMVLFFDMTSLQPPDLERATAAAHRFVREQMSPADLVGVIVFGNQLQVLTDFTSDRDLLDRAIGALRPGKEADLAELAADTSVAEGTASSPDNGAAFTADETEFNVFNTDRKLAALQSVADLLRDIPGKKSVLQFTSGITQTGDENRTQLRSTTDAANRANVSIYTVDSRGLLAEAPGGNASMAGASGTGAFTGTAVFQQSDARDSSRQTLITLAEDTGGRSFFDLGDLSEAFKAVHDDTGGYYLLSYYTTNALRDGRWRAIRVRVSGLSGAHVTFREGYYAPKDFGVYTTEDREKQLDDAMHSQAPLVELPLAVETSWFRLDRTQVFVPISAKLASSALQWAQKNDRREVQFDFVAEIRQAQSGRLVGSLRDTITVHLDTERFQQIQQNALVYQGGIILSPGAYKLKFLARENESGRIGTFEDDLTLPAAAPSRIQLSSLVLSSQLVAVQKTSEVQTKAFARDVRLKESPLEVAGERVIPSVTRVFTNQQTLYILFQAYAPEKSDLGRLRAGLTFFRDGRHINQTPLVEPAQVNEANHTASFRISVPLATVGSGRYTVQAIVVEAGGEQAGFGRGYFALRATTAAPVPVPAAPAASPNGN
jgi:VWFA-related protein